MEIPNNILKDFDYLITRSGRRLLLNFKCVQAIAICKLQEVVTIYTSSRSFEIPTSPENEQPLRALIVYLEKTIL